MRVPRGLAAVALFAGTAAFALAADVVVLKGGTVISLKQPMVRRGNTVYLTRTDGTLLSVPASEIDREATAAASAKAAPAPAAADAPGASTPAEAVRGNNKDGPKAKVRITDADVSHPMEDVPVAGTETKQAPGGPKVEVVDYTQEKTDTGLQIHGSLRNPGQGTAENVRLTVTVLDEKGESIGGGMASLSKSAIESGLSVAFSASIPVGDKNVGQLRFSPQWSTPTPVPTPAPRPGTAAAAAAAAAAKAPTPRPTPYGRGTLYAAPVSSAPSVAPADGKTGYIPNASSPDNQPKPPSR